MTNLEKRAREKAAELLFNIYDRETSTTMAEVLLSQALLAFAQSECEKTVKRQEELLRVADKLCHAMKEIDMRHMTAHEFQIINSFWMEYTERRKILNPATEKAE